MLLVLVLFGAHGSWLAGVESCPGVLRSWPWTRLLSIAALGGGFLPSITTAQAGWQVGTAASRKRHALNEHRQTATKTLPRFAEGL